MNLRKKLLPILSIVGIMGVLTAVTVFTLPSPVEAIVEIASGTKTVQVASKLARASVIQSSWLFMGYVKVTGSTIQAGVYKFPKGSTIASTANMLDRGEVFEHIVTIPEGWRITQIAKRLDDQRVISGGDFLAASEGKEGYLFPDTYRVRVGATAGEVVELMEDNFLSRTNDFSLDRTDVILASIIEREAKSDEERPLISGVYANRLRLGMALQADPTIQYAKGSWDPITVSDYKLNSPYNTYLYRGLPPGPICNPGLKSIEAAKNPATHGYYYFFHTSNGQLVLSETLNEHNRKKSEFLR